MPDLILQVWNILGVIFYYFWWIILPVFLGYTLFKLWMNYIRTKFLKSIEWKVLEVRIPKEVLRTPKAMEQVFSGLHGSTAGGSTFTDKYIKGKLDTWLSFEIVSVGGQTRFMVRAP